MTNPQGLPSDISIPLITVECRNDPPTASCVRRILLVNGLAAGDYMFPNFVLAPDIQPSNQVPTRPSGV